jgi:hypothetical protein
MSTGTGTVGEDEALKGDEILTFDRASVLGDLFFNWFTACYFFGMPKKQTGADESDNWARFWYSGKIGNAFRAGAGGETKGEAMYAG